MSTISIFDIFKIGIGPSSSHTGGPMAAAFAFSEQIKAYTRQVARVQVTLFGSLAFTGKGHGTDTAIILGLMGYLPATIDPDAVESLLRAVHASKKLALPEVGVIDFDPQSELLFNYETELPRHTNGMRFVASDAAGAALLSEDYYSLGGGFIARGNDPEPSSQSTRAKHEFSNSATLLAAAAAADLSIAELVLRNEQQWRSADEVTRRMDDIWSAMQACIARGLKTDGVLPGRMAVLRRAAKLRRTLEARVVPMPLDTLDWVNAFAIAVNEENAAGGRVVTSPTNGAAGIIPAVMMYYQRFVPNASQAGIHRFLLTAGAIGILYKVNASISGAEMGCQGEVGVACSMAAAGLVAALGGSNDHVEEAAEIGMEHNLGLTCDPIGGMVQIPCIERNAMGAVKAINAARLAMHGDGTHKVTLDNVIATMRQTGLDMSSSYKETSKGGLAVNVPEC
ncbi:MAG: L-serine ammonia-lyase [Gammaproteobacteria bacterium]|nr:L-serine ammonia-lyase [Gammaproteobacteria bacterium]